MARSPASPRSPIATTPKRCAASSCPSPAPSCPCETEAGELLGRVVAVENFGAGDLLEIEKPDGKKSLIPFRDGIAELGDGRIVADPTFLA